MRYHEGHIMSYLKIQLDQNQYGLYMIVCPCVYCFILYKYIVVYCYMLI